MDSDHDFLVGARFEFISGVVYYENFWIRAKKFDLSLIIIVWDVKLDLFDFPEVDLQVEANKTKDGDLPEVDYLAFVAILIGNHIKVVQNVLRRDIEVYLGFPLETLQQVALRSR